MPTLRKLSITNLRNISAAELSPCDGFNVFYGVNGSGKTSILEAIHLLAVGRSFRSHVRKPVIKDEEATLTIYGETSTIDSLGIQRSVRGSQLMRVNGKKLDSLASLTRYVPVQLINSETFQILEGSPRQRRQFMDWGVFHVEQPFLNCWKQAKTALINRNNLLKSEASFTEIEPWSQELVKNAIQIDHYRSKYTEEFAGELKRVICKLFDEELGEKFQFRYIRGWSIQSDLLEQLHQDMARDRRYGFTTSGPHKADLMFRIGEYSAAEVLSRGQLKLMICALKIAQGALLYRLTKKHCIFLIDDLPAELDPSNRTKVCNSLGELQDQIFLTTIEARLYAV
jgi:DNA replication and repair protein RecF